VNDIKIGVAGFSYREWENIVYPKALKSTQRLAYIAQFFNLVEINTSFYGPIKPSVGREWCHAVASVNSDFVFTAKLYRAFTHSPISNVQPTSAETIRFSEKDVADTKAGFDSLAGKGKLGAVLAQFPMSFKRTDENQGYVEALAKHFCEYPLVLEVRHASWDNADVLQWLRALGLGLCNIDQPLLGRAIQPGTAVTSSVGYIRLHGRNYEQWFAEETNARDRYDYLYSQKELGQWKQRAEEVAVKTKKTFVVANNHNAGKAAVNALQLISLLTSHKVQVPLPLIERYAELKRISN
jgi:uncharacterized protein YecE (DUF72 family)